MQTRQFLFATVAAVGIIAGFSSCRKTIELGNKPNLEFVSGTDLISTDSTLVMDKKYQIEIHATNAENQTPNTYFEITRTYSGGGDTTVYYEDLVGDKQTDYYYTHAFTTLKRGGTERYTFTVKNNYGIVNQKVLVMTVK